MGEIKWRYDTSVDGGCHIQLKTPERMTCWQAVDKKTRLLTAIYLIFDERLFPFLLDLFN